MNIQMSLANQSKLIAFTKSRKAMADVDCCLMIERKGQCAVQVVVRILISSDGADFRGAKLHRGKTLKRHHF